MDYFNRGTLIINVEMDEARLRALTHSYVWKCLIDCNTVEMDEARLRALTHRYHSAID